jgi:hypothetical protein
VALGRSVWSEYVFCVLVLSLGAALTVVLAARATGSVLLGVMAAVFEIAMRPRLYNWPKIIIYVAAIAVLWAWLAAPTRRRRWMVAGMTAVAFLLRHDHGLYVGVAFAVALAVVDLPWRERVRHAARYALATLVLLAPYLVYLQVHGGVIEHFAAGARYSARDYDRTPLELPVPTFETLVVAPAGDGEAAWWAREPFATLAGSYSTWWLYWLMALLPPVALLLLLARRATGPPAWAGEGPKVCVLAVLAMVLHVRLVRGNLDGRFADVAVPMVVLGVWALAAAFRIAVSPVRGAPAVLARAARVAPAVGAVLVVAATAVVLVRPAGELVRNASLLEGLGAVSLDRRLVTRLTERTWPMDTWTDETRGQVGLAKYLQACTAPGDRVLMAPFFPTVYGLAQRGFAGGRLDLRGGFYDTPAEQALTLERLRAQTVPVVIGPPSDGAEEFAAEFPSVAAYLADAYRSAGDYDVGEGLSFALLVHADAEPVGTWEPLGFPCFR